MGKPGAAFAWAVASVWRKRGLVVAAWHYAERFRKAPSSPLLATLLYGFVLWTWHSPGLFVEAIQHDWLHKFEHLTFLSAALLFWRVIVDARSTQRASLALLAAGFTMVHSGLLGALITMSPHPLYSWYVERSEVWGFDPLEDQQLAGLTMWVPMGAIYLAACLIAAGRLISPQERWLVHARGGIDSVG
jgi:putative membrane protein